MNNTTVMSSRPDEIATCPPRRSVTVKSVIFSCPKEAAIIRSASPTSIRILLFAFDFQIDYGLLARIERAQSPHWAGGALVLGLERIVYIRVQAAELIRTLLLRDEGAHLQCLGVF